jgi:hypothetical protein
MKFSALPGKLPDGAVGDAVQRMERLERPHQNIRVDQQECLEPV